MPDLTYAKREDIPADLADHVKEVEGKFVVSVVPKANITEFRDRNIAISKERDALKALVDSYTGAVGDDVEKIKNELAQLRQIDADVKAGNLKGDVAIRAEVDRRLKEVNERHSEALAKAAQERDAEKAARIAADQKLKRSIVDQAVTNAVLAKESGVNPTALPDILHRAHSIFSVAENDKLIAKDGDAIRYGNDGVTPLSPQEWLTRVLVEAPYLALQSNGGGAASGDKTGLKGVTSDELAQMSGSEMLRRARAK
jgi:hypothetical protein